MFIQDAFKAMVHTYLSNSIDPKRVYGIEPDRVMKDIQHMEAIKNYIIKYLEDGRDNKKYMDSESVAVFEGEEAKAFLDYAQKETTDEEREELRKALGFYNKVNRTSRDKNEHQ